MSHYFDHAATTPMRSEAQEAWLRHAGALNPGGQYASGRAARGALESAREEIAGLLGADPVEVIFTGSGTEADNLAIQGLYRASSLPRLLSSPVEHPAVREVIAHLAAQGAEVEWLPVDAGGHVKDLGPVAHPAALVACMYANNETGALQPVEPLIERAREAGTPVHIDAVQALGHRAIDFHGLGATTLAGSAHKFGGPRGVGLLLARRSPAPQPVFFGGGQERGIRPGTNDVAGAAATAAALRAVLAEREAEEARLRVLRDDLLRRVLHEIDEVRVNTVEPALPGHLSLSFPGAEGDSLIMLLDSLGIEAATGSACHSGVNRASEVLLAMGVPEGEARGTVRFTLGRTTTEEDVDYLVAHLPEVVRRARLAGMA
ncbi:MULTISPECIES: cysteine desulfurase family protein [unclassified Corynebacterium]|uniref:cysteine desulfurase family protein n=1 Tax=unclassified Corynebacterium TaxID=2624378 RepID=UPI0029C9C07B|nr:MULTISPECIES: cysteine desulfurase family protein [unclassified Corynebacterium]WPF67028.1 cysteine desulfurase family protein [Corynebacterium sp. 22KM0430]WPF69516.1 cysteine desulfurase family protein [Corynebacterium sp. 21KM1197]